MIKLRLLVIATMVVSFSLAGCSDTVLESMEPEPGSAFDAAVTAQNAFGTDDESGRHLVVFSNANRIPDNFAQRVEQLGGSIDATYEAIGTIVVSGLSDAAATALRRHNDTQHVERDVRIQWIDPNMQFETFAVENTAEVTANPAAAFFFPRQWHLRAIGAPQAWAAGRVGSPEVKVAILDTGLSPTHLDLQGRIDYDLSRSFEPFDDQFIDFYFPLLPKWVDLHFHGTHAGATVASNAVAAAGVTSGVTLIAVKVLGVDGAGFTSNVLAGLMYAADVGADVANMSLGSYFNKSDFPGFVATINRAFNYANRQGMLVVVSAGNEDLNMNATRDGYKAYCDSPHVVCVSATGPTAAAGINGPWTNVDAKAWYSNYGSAVSVAAPGGNGLGGTNSAPVSAACSRQSLQIPVCQTGTFVVGLSGTSMAAPHVSGLAALVIEDVGKGRPSLVANRIAQGADDLGARGRDPIYGRGRINVPNSLGL
jgi:lantibiotic leader peptide-processing serine protease